MDSKTKLVEVRYAPLEFMDGSGFHPIDELGESTPESRAFQERISRAVIEAVEAEMSLRERITREIIKELEAGE